MRKIVALGGGGFSVEPNNPLLDDFILSLAKTERPKVCFVPTASGDSDNYVARFYRFFDSSRCIPSHLPLFDGHLADIGRLLSNQDVIYVGGGNTANLLSIWRLHGVDKAIMAAWRKGVVLCGVSAGAMCWFEAGLTDSFGSRLRPLRDGLGLLKGAFCPHYDAEHERRPALHRALRRGFPTTLAVNNSVALYFVGSKLKEAISSVSNSCAYHVRLVGTQVLEEPIDTRYLGKTWC